MDNKIRGLISIIIAAIFLWQQAGWARPIDASSLPLGSDARSQESLGTNRAVQSQMLRPRPYAEAKRGPRLTAGHSKPAAGTGKKGNVPADFHRVTLSKTPTWIGDLEEALGILRNDLSSGGFPDREGLREDVVEAVQVAVFAAVDQCGPSEEISISWKMADNILTCVVIGKGVVEEPTGDQIEIPDCEDISIEYISDPESGEQDIKITLRWPVRKGAMPRTGVVRAGYVPNRRFELVNSIEGRPNPNRSSSGSMIINGLEIKAGAVTDHRSDDAIDRGYAAALGRGKRRARLASPIGSFPVTINGLQKTMHIISDIDIGGIPRTFIVDSEIIDGLTAGGNQAGQMRDLIAQAIRARGAELFDQLPAGPYHHTFRERPFVIIAVDRSRHLCEGHKKDSFFIGVNHALLKVGAKDRGAARIMFQVCVGGALRYAAGQRDEKALAREDIVTIWKLTALSGPSERGNILAAMKSVLAPGSLFIDEFERTFIPKAQREGPFDLESLAGDIKAKGVRVHIYAEAYGGLGIYFFQRDLDWAGYTIKERIQAPISRRPLERLPESCYKTLNRLFRDRIFRYHRMAPNKFFKILPELITGLERYRDLNGMLRLAGATGTHIGLLYDTFGGEKGAVVIDTLANMERKEDRTLSWERMDLSISWAVVLIGYAQMPLRGGETYEERLLSIISQQPSEERTVRRLLTPEAEVSLRRALLLPGIEVSGEYTLLSAQI